MHPLETRPLPGEYDLYYDLYVSRVPGGNLAELLERQIERVHAVAHSFCGERGGGAGEQFAYAPGKWPVRTLMQHVVDTERVMGYRVLRFARRDPTPLPGFDQDVFATNGGTDQRSLAQFCTEFEHVRRSNIALISGFDVAALAWSGSMWDKKVSLLALCLLLHGHAGHHLDVLEERYV